jgi:radical SAM protein with 4Fe4S-binding SPASM domain
LLEHLENEDIEECEIYWQGGEAMIMGPGWFADAGNVMDRLAAERGRRFTHYLQTNLISYSPAWNDVIRGMFQNSLGTSMDYPNIHRKLFKGGAKAYTELWSRRLQEAKAAGIEVGVIAVLHQASLEAGPESFYRYFTEELGLNNFQVNTPFPGGPASQIEGRFQLDLDELARFLGVLVDIWMERGYHSGVALTRMLKTSRARRDFVERPKRLVQDEECLSCRYLSICHGGCPVRTYSARGTMMTKDPYCEVYKVVFARAETHARALLRRRLAINGN